LNHFTAKYSKNENYNNGNNNQHMQIRTAIDVWQRNINGWNGGGGMKNLGVVNKTKPFECIGEKVEHLSLRFVRPITSEFSPTTHSWVLIGGCHKSVEHFQLRHRQQQWCGKGKKGIPLASLAHAHPHILSSFPKWEGGQMFRVYNLQIMEKLLLLSKRNAKA